jgi:hypothetical protein
MSVDYRKLADELTTDPAALGYAGMTDAQAATALNRTNGGGRAVTRELVPAYEVWEAIVPAEWDAITAAEKERIRITLSLGTVMMRGPNTRAALRGAFGAGTATRAALLALQTEAKSRAAELGLGPVTARDVSVARGGKW